MTRRTRRASQPAQGPRRDIRPPRDALVEDGGDAPHRQRAQRVRPHRGLCHRIVHTRPARVSSSMLAEGKAVRLVPEVGGDINSIHALPENDLLIVRDHLERASRAGSARASRRAVHSRCRHRNRGPRAPLPPLDDVLAIGEGSDEGSSLHSHLRYAPSVSRVLFDRLFAQYARALREPPSSSKNDETVVALHHVIDSSHTRPRCY